MQSLPKFVQSRLQREALSAAGSHPGADLLTAFAERSISGRERDHIVEHLARCGDCREVVALAFPAELESPAPALRTKTIRTNWFLLPALRASFPRWALVTAGVLIIASLGTVQYRREHARNLVFNTPREQEIAAVIPSTSIAETQPSSSVHIGSQSSRSVVERNSTASRVLQSKTAGLNAASRVSESLAQNGSTAEGAANQSSPEQSSTGPDSADPSTDTALDQWDVVDKAKPAFPQAESDLVPAPSLHPDPRLLQNRIAPRWAIANGALQRSLDGGKTWLNVVPSANGAALTGDIVGIQFTDPRNGTVTTSNAEVWVTADAGQTWRKQR